MQTLETRPEIISPNPPKNAVDADDSYQSEMSTSDADEPKFHLGLWFSGLECFLNLYSSDLVKENYRDHDWSKEVRLTRSVLQMCAKVTMDFSKDISLKNSPLFKGKKFELLDDSDSQFAYETVSEREINHLSLALRESILFSDAILRSNALDFRDWNVWCRSLIGKLKGSDVVQKLIRASDREAETYLPIIVKQLLAREDTDTKLLSDLKIVLPLFAKVLKSLQVVDGMLKNDRPLKSALVLFAKINDQMHEMMDYINNRLLRYPNEEDALFGSLDSAAYTASIELRKVFDQELKELIDIRPTPVVFSKIENSFALLNDSLQLTLVNFAQLIDPNVNSQELFLDIKLKEERSLILRDEMWKIVQAIKAAEKEPDSYPLEKLNEQLIEFSELSVGMLFSKDIETVGRFVEEVTRTKEKTDLVPTLHRFGAYLETLLGQVNMRVALVDHPFAPLERNPHDMFG